MLIGRYYDYLKNYLKSFFIETTDQTTRNYLKPSIFNFFIIKKPGIC